MGCSMTFPKDLWTIVLAGGSGCRVRTLTTRPDGTAVPKQYWPFRSDGSPLHRTISRARRLVADERIVAVVADQHREWWMDELADLLPENILSQPENRGTAVGVLHALFYVTLQSEAPVLVFLPSDHDVEGEHLLLEAIETAIQAVRLRPEIIVMLGMAPEGADSEYGWIVPSTPSLDGTQEVLSFVEKPTEEVARDLLRQGAALSTFIFVSSGPRLLELYRDLLPDLVQSYTRACLDRGWHLNAVRPLFENLPERDFTRDILQRAVSTLHILPVSPCGWVDLGTPERVTTWRAGRGFR